MIEKIKASKSEKIIFIFVVILGLFSITSFVLLKDKCLFVKNIDPNKIYFTNTENIAIMNVECGNVIIELDPITSFVLLKDKCLFVKNYDPNKINFENPNNIAIPVSYTHLTLPTIAVV